MSSSKHPLNPGPAGVRSAPAGHPASFILIVEVAQKELEATALAQSIKRFGDDAKVFDGLLKASWAVASREDLDLVTLAGLFLRLSVLVYSFGHDLMADGSSQGGLK